MGEGSPQSIVGVCEVEADAVYTSAAERRGRQEMGGGKRKPELESQTKRVTQKQKLRDTKFKKKKTTYSDRVQSLGYRPQPAPLVMNLSTSQEISGPLHSSTTTGTVMISNW